MTKVHLVDCVYIEMVAGSGPLVLKFQVPFIFTVVSRLLVPIAI